MNSRNPLLRLYLLTALALALNATAQSTWTNSAGGNWSVAANWTGGVPVSGGTTILNFTAAGAYSVTNDLWKRVDCGGSEGVVNL